MNASAGKRLWAYVLWLLAGTLGAHRFYCRRTGSAVAMLVIWIVQTPLVALATWGPMTSLSTGLLIWPPVSAWWNVRLIAAMMSPQTFMANDPEGAYVAPLVWLLTLPGTMLTLCAVIDGITMWRWRSPEGARTVAR